MFAPPAPGVGPQYSTPEDAVHAYVSGSPVNLMPDSIEDVGRGRFLIRDSSGTPIAEAEVSELDGESYFVGSVDVLEC